jgi:hypothetical protein
MSDRSSRLFISALGCIPRALIFVTMMVVCTGGAHAQFTWVSDGTYVYNTGSGGQDLMLGYYSGGDIGEYTQIGGYWLPSATAEPHYDCSCNYQTSSTAYGTWTFYSSYLGHIGGTIEVWGIEWQFLVPEIDLTPCEGCYTCSSPSSETTYWGYYDTYYEEVWVDVG